LALSAFFSGMVFVAPDDVHGTLSEGFRIYQRLTEPLHRAIFMMFLVSEVHPFTDGNGRIARIMMNAELAAADQVRVLIPIVYRWNYLAALRALSCNAWPEPIIKTLAFAQRYVAARDLVVTGSPALEIPFLRLTPRSRVVITSVANS
jgi:hypothetical protein